MLKRTYLLFFISLVFMFEQNDYFLEFKRLEVLTYNKKYVNFAKVTTFKYNRSQTLFNGTIDLAVDLGHDVEVIVQAFKFASNEYRLFPLRFSFNLCEAISKNDFGLNKVFRYGNFSGCPLKAVRFCFNNWVPDAKRFPPNVPNGDYRIGLQLMFRSDEVMSADGYGIVSRPLDRRH